MEILGIQIIGVLFGLLIAYVAFLNLKRKEFTSREFGVWLIIGLVFVVFSMFPVLIYPISGWVKLTRPLDLFIILGFLFIIGAVFYVYSVVRKTQRALEQLVRKIAIEKMDDQHRKKRE